LWMERSRTRVSYCPADVSSSPSSPLMDSQRPSVDSTARTPRHAQRSACESWVHLGTEVRVGPCAHDSTMLLDVGWLTAQCASMHEQSRSARQDVDWHAVQLCYSDLSHKACHVTNHASPS
jgi:hypothetical protein